MLHRNGIVVDGRRSERLADWLTTVNAGKNESGTIERELLITSWTLPLIVWPNQLSTANSLELLFGKGSTTRLCFGISEENKAFCFLQFFLSAPFFGQWKDIAMFCGLLITLITIPIMKKYFYHFIGFTEGTKHSVVWVWMMLNLFFQAMQGFVILLVAPSYKNLADPQ